MTLRAKALASLAALLGAAALVVGAFLSGDYAQAVLVEVGAALLLVAPLLLLERVLEARVALVQDTAREAANEAAALRAEVQRTAERLDDLADRTRQQVAALEEIDDALSTAFEEEASASNAVRLLRRAIDMHAVPLTGIRVPVPVMHQRIRFAPSEDSAIRVTVEDLDGSPLGAVDWEEPETASQLLGRVAEILQRQNTFPGAGAFDGTLIMAHLLRSLTLPIEKKRRGSVLDLSPIIEIVNDQWAVTTHGLECLENPYRVPRSRLREEGFQSHVAEKTWVDEDDFYMAWLAADVIHLGIHRDRFYSADAAD